MNFIYVSDRKRCVKVIINTIQKFLYKRQDSFIKVKDAGLLTSILIYRPDPMLSLFSTTIAYSEPSSSRSHILMAPFKDLPALKKL